MVAGGRLFGISRFPGVVAVPDGHGCAIAAARYGDPTLWRPIAEENNLDDPLAIQPGQVLVIPAIE